MKKAFLIIVVLALMFTTSCGYKITENKDGSTVLTFPNGTKYYLSNMGYWCLNNGYSDKGETLGKLPCEICDDAEDDHGLDIFLPPNIVNENIVLVDYDFMHGLDGHADVYVKEGVDIPTFTATDTLEAVYYLSDYEYSKYMISTDLVDAKPYLDTKLVSKDIKDFADRFIEQEHDYNNDRLDGYDFVGHMIYRFRDTGDLYFQHIVGYSEAEKKYAVEGLFDGGYCVYYIPEDVFEELVFAEIGEIQQWPTDE